MAIAQLLNPNDMSSTEAWNVVVSAASAASVTLTGPVYSANFTGNFNISGQSITGTATSATQLKNGVAQILFSNVSIDAVTLANMIGSGLNAVSIYSYVLRGNDTVTGSTGNDLLGGGPGSDAINGGAGNDIAFFSGTRANYTITTTSSGYTVTDNRGVDGTDTLTGVERLKFTDTSLAFDSAGTAGQAFRLYQTAFNRSPDQGGLGFQVNVLDKGAGLASVAANFIASPEFASTYGNLDNTQFVNQLYLNVLKRGADTGGLAYHVGNLNSGFNARADVLVGFSESAENQAALIGVISAGMVYTTF